MMLLKPNVGKEKKSSLGNLTRKKLSDISNLPPQARVSTLDEKSHLVPIATEEYNDQLKKVRIHPFLSVKVFIILSLSISFGCYEILNSGKHDSS